jgi:hypothetical protein
MTYATASSFDDPLPAKGPPKSALKKPSVGTGVKKPTAGTAAMRKKRELEIAGFIDMLPLEYRGREPVSTDSSAVRILADLITGYEIRHGEGHCDVDG